MAQRRMFSKSITNSSQFLMMPSSSQNLYFHIGMNADDDGFCEHFTIMRMTDSKPDDLKILQAKGFVNVFDDRVLIILDWKENNYLRSDRYTPSKYLDVYKDELKRLSSGIPNGDTGKDRIGKVREVKNSIEKNTYGQFQNVLLTEEEYKKLEESIGKSKTDNLIEELSIYIESNKKGKNYLSHYATILSWNRRKEKDTKTNVYKNNNSDNIIEKLKAKQIKSNE
jgi:hypothetical protein